MRAPMHDFHVSNLLTYVSLATGVAALGAALDGGSPLMGGAALTIAVVADTFDGRFARRFRRSPRQSRIGHELDGLVDAVVFGLAPVAVLGAARVPGSLLMTLVWWAAATFYLLAVITRLAFYSVEDDDTRFVGVPTPAAAMLCVTALLWQVPAWATAWPFVIGGALMIAPVAFPRPRGLVLGTFVAWALFLFVGLSALAF